MATIKLIEAAAQSWAEKGETHRALAFQIATSELKKSLTLPRRSKAGATSTSLTKLADAARTR